MIQKFDLFPGVRLYCYPDDRFKHGCMSVQLVRPMREDEAALNALIPAVLLRGSKNCPDLRSITLRLDDLYGASVGTLVRRVGDYQTTGLYTSFVEDRYALDGDAILMPMAEFLRELLLEPVLDKGAFRKDYVESEKKNLISTIESQRNDKRTYAMEQLMRHMCQGDSFGYSRLGEIPNVKKITPESLHAHYRKVLEESRIDVVYVGSAQPETVAGFVRAMFQNVKRNFLPLPEQTAFHGGEPGSYTETMDVSQGKLCMGFVTPMTIRSADYVPMQLLNLVFGGGMTSKLFMHIREEKSLCYAIGSAYRGSKGILTVSAGIDCNMEETVKEQIMEQLEACRKGQISEEELSAAKEAMRSGLQTVHDSPGNIENYYATAMLSDFRMPLAEYAAAVEAVTVEQLAEAAKTLQLHSVFFLKGVS